MMESQIIWTSLGASKPSMSIDMYLHLYSAPSLRSNRRGNTLAHGVSHFWSNIPKTYGGEGSNSLCKHWNVGRIYRMPPWSRLSRKLWLNIVCPMWVNVFPERYVKRLIIFLTILYHVLICFFEDIKSNTFLHSDTIPLVLPPNV